MKDFETIKEYSIKLLSTTSKIRLLGRDLADSRIVKKILVTVSKSIKHLVLHWITQRICLRLLWKKCYTPSRPNNNED